MKTGSLGEKHQRNFTTTIIFTKFSVLFVLLYLFICLLVFYGTPVALTLSELLKVFHPFECLANVTGNRKRTKKAGSLHVSSHDNLTIIHGTSFMNNKEE